MKNNYRLNHNELLQSLGLPTSSNEDLFDPKPSKSSFHQNQNINELLLCMTIDLGDGKKDVLNLYSNDDPKDLARQFCVKNHLNLEAVEILTRNIIDNLNSHEEIKENKHEIKENYDTFEKKNVYDAYNFYKKAKKEENQEDYQMEFNETNAKNERNDKNTVYDRLHQNAMEKQENVKKSKAELKKQVSLSISKEKNIENLAKKPNIQNEPNYGVKLYLKGLKQKEEQQLIVQKKKKQQIEKEEQELTFKPKVKNPKLAQFQVNRKIDNIGDHLIQMGRKNKETREKLLAEKQKEEVVGCSFKPHIDSISQKIMIEKLKISSENSENQKVHQRLYNHFKPKYEKEAVEGSNYSFKPQLLSEPLGSSNDLTFLERLERVQKAKEERIKEMKENEEIKEKDEFKPKIGRPPKIERNQHNLPIGDYLYLNKLEKEQKKKELINKEIRETEETKAKSNEKSHAIFENMKAKKVEEYFNLLDSDKDGEISASKVEISQLPIFVLEKIAPLLCEMEQMNLTLDFYNFSQAFLKLSNNFSIDEKNRLFFDTRQKWNEKKKNFDNFTFKPEINKKSIKMSEENKEYKTMTNFYEKNKENTNQFTNEPENKEKADYVQNIVEIVQKQ